MGMGKAWAEASGAAAEVFKRADEVLGFSLSDICFNGPDERVHRTDVAQPALYTAAIASVRGLIERGELSEGDVVAAAGLSLGEWTALHLAGVFSFEEGLRLVHQRGTFMQEAAESSGGSMVALIGGDEDQANAVCEGARGGEVLVPANFNCPGQIVISGSKGACERALGVAEKLELRATALTVAGAFHSPLMESAAERMTAALEGVAFEKPAVPVPSNVTGGAHGDDVDQIKRLLVEQITSAVRWDSNVRWLLENVEGGYIEAAPGKVLSGLMRRIDRGTKVANHAEPK